MSGDDSLRGNTSDSAHGQPSVQKLIQLVLLLPGLILGIQHPNAIISRSSLPLHSRLNRRIGDDDVPETDPKKQLVHGPLQKSVVRIDRLGHGLETVGLAGDSDEVGDDVPEDGELGGASVANFGFAEEGDEGGVGLGEAEGVEFEFAAFEVDAAGVGVPDGGGEGGGGFGGGGRGKGGGGAGEGEDGGDGFHGGLDVDLGGFGK
mmetsp:Transcript_24740/g.52046  ORF Transcript_24740/g.52046 Transcript_24740/m.52046 type:complete len:205 (-) Transcript_24740:134-748(-)